MIIFLYGEDLWRKKQKLAQIIEKFIREIDPSKMNVQTIEASEASEETLRSKILAAPFLARKRMVVIKNLLTDGRRQALFEIAFEALKNLAEHSAVVISEDQAKPKKWKNQDAKLLWEYLEKNATSEEFKPFWGVRLEKEIHAQAKAHGLTLQHDAAALLAIMSQGDLGQVEHELKKLSAYLSTGLSPDEKRAKPCTADDVKTVCISAGETNIFEFLDALGIKDQKKLMNALEEQLEENEPTQLIARIVAHLRALLVVGLKGVEGGQALHLHPYQLKKITSQIRNWDPPTLKRFLTELMMLDFSIKRGFAADAATQLTSLLAQVTV